MYLITKDYQRVIQTSELNAITGNDVSIRQLVEGSVQTEIYSNLLQRFDVASEFTDTDVYSNTPIYKAGKRIYLDATTYNPANTFSLNALTLFQGNIYYCSTAIIVPEIFTPAHWTLLGAQNDLFFVTLPFPLFNELTIYYKGDKVFWKDNVYTAAKDSIPEDQQNALQAPSIQSINYGNPLPDDRFNGKAFWGTGVPYALTAGTYPTDTAKWTKGDNRNQMLIAMMMDMVVYDLCKRIAPNNVPEARHNAWIRACKNLENFADGKLNAQIAVIQPKTGGRIRFGGKTQQINDY